MGRPSVVRPAARRLRCAPESGPLDGCLPEGAFHAQPDADQHHSGFRRLRQERAVGTYANPAGEPGWPPAQLRARQQGHPGRMGERRSTRSRARPSSPTTSATNTSCSPTFGRLVPGRHDQRGDHRHAVVGAGAVPHRGRARAAQWRRPVERPGRRAAGRARPHPGPEGRAGQGGDAAALAERRQRAVLPAGSQELADQLSRPAQGR